MSQVPVLIVGKWSLGYSDAQRVSVIKFEFKDRPPVTLAIENAEAEAIGKALLEQLEKRRAVTN